MSTAIGLLFLSIIFVICVGAIVSLDRISKEAKHYPCEQCDYDSADDTMDCTHDPDMNELHRKS